MITRVKDTNNLYSLVHCRNLDEAERRCSRLQSLLQVLNPHIDIEALLGNERRQRRHPQSIPLSPDLETEEARGIAPPLNDYEWHEVPLSPLANSSREVGGLGDGMASLPTNHINRVSLVQDHADLFPMNEH